MWSEEASSDSIERAAVWLGDNTALLAAGKTNTDAISFSFFNRVLRLKLLQRKKIWLDLRVHYGAQKKKAHNKIKLHC